MTVQFDFDDEAHAGQKPEKNAQVYPNTMAGPPGCLPTAATFQEVWSTDMDGSWSQPGSDERR
eukprot:11162420-Lingulodinium_polyedra.AAC.1